MKYAIGQTFYLLPETARSPRKATDTYGTITSFNGDEYRVHWSDEGGGSTWPYDEDSIDSYMENGSPTMNTDKTFSEAEVLALLRRATTDGTARRIASDAGIKIPDRTILTIEIDDPGVGRRHSDVAEALAAWNPRNSDFKPVS